MNQTYALSVGVENSPEEGPAVVQYPLVFGEPEVELLSHDSSFRDDTQGSTAALELVLPDWAWLTRRPDSPTQPCSALVIARPYTLGQIVQWLDREPE